MCWLAKGVGQPKGHTGPRTQSTKSGGRYQEGVSAANRGRVSRPVRDTEDNAGVFWTSDPSTTTTSRRRTSSTASKSTTSTAVASIRMAARVLPAVLPHSSPSSPPPPTSPSPTRTSTATTATTTTRTTPHHAKNMSVSGGPSAAGCRPSCCWLWKGMLNPRGIFMWPLSLHVLLLTLCYCRHVSSDDQLNLIHARLVNMLKTKQSLFYRRHLRSDGGMDLREHRVFHSDPKLDCCPTLTEFEPRRTGINPGGMVLELFSSNNFTQSFYETICHPSLRNRPCQFIDPRISYATRCIQQFSYVYAIGRTYGSDEGFRVDYIRIPAGCKCQVKKTLLRRRKKKSVVLQ